MAGTPELASEWTRAGFRASFSGVSKSKVAIIRTSAPTVLEDYHRVMNLAGYQQVIDRSADTALKVNISWHFFYPAS